jgi:hypothetical protein
MTLIENHEDKQNIKEINAMVFTYYKEYVQNKSIKNKMVFELRDVEF